MKFLVIGSKGFIGGHLFNFLKEKGHTVWGSDVIVDYETTSNYFLIDSTNSDYHSAFSQEGYDVCINCAGAASVPDSLANPYRDFSLNALTVYKLLEAIRLYQPECKFVNLSSAAVYGNPAELPITEKSPAIPVSPYGIHKHMSEQICEEFYRFFNIQTLSLRIFSAYGEGLTKQLFWDLYQKAKNKPLVILYGTGNESRDFIYIRDLVRVIEIIALKAPFNGASINIANGEEILIGDVVNTFYKNFDQPIRFEFDGTIRPGDPQNWVADIGYIKKLGYQQEYNLNDGLKNYFQWLIQKD